MKILLLGEFSSLHSNIQEGLQAIGHEVVLASAGDGYRNVSRDIDLSKKENLGIFKNAEQLLRILSSTKNFKDFDVVQLMSPIVFPIKFGINEKIINKLKENNDKLFLLGAGASMQNTIIANFFQNDYKYPDFYKYIKSEQLKQLWSQTEKGRLYNDWLHNKIEGYIPIMYEYAQGYRNVKHKKLRQTIPIPVNLDKINYVGNRIKNKIVIFHAISRADKGTHLISEALEKIQAKYPNDVEVLLRGNLPLNEYLKLLDKTNVVIDQTFAVSYGVNAIYNLAKGKIVMGGGEDECLKEFGVIESPLIPILPDVNDIVIQLEALIAEKNIFEQKGFESRQFAEKMHDSKKVAQQYIETWNKNY